MISRHTERQVCIDRRPGLLFQTFSWRLAAGMPVRRARMLFQTEGSSPVARYLPHRYDFTLVFLFHGRVRIAFAGKICENPHWMNRRSPYRVGIVAAPKIQYSIQCAV